MIGHILLWVKFVAGVLVSLLAIGMTAAVLLGRRGQKEGRR